MVVLRRRKRSTSTSPTLTRTSIGLPIVIVRFFNTVGPRQTGAYAGVLPRLVAQAMLGEQLTIYGDGTQTRCFCDVEDVVRAVTSLLDLDTALGEAFNIGSTEEVSMTQLAERILGSVRFGVGDLLPTVRRRLRRQLRGHPAPRAGHGQGP